MKWILNVVFVGFVVAVTCEGAFSQATGQIGGTIRDQGGALLTGVSVTATKTDTGLSRSTVTNETGSYVLSSLALGPYRLEAALEGFKTFIQSGIVVEVNSGTTVNLVLQVGPIKEQIEVKANVSLVDTKNVGVGRTVDPDRIMELPLNGRNAQELLLLVGASSSVVSCCAQAFPGRLLIASAGALGPASDYNLDGIRHVDPWDGLPMTLPFPDALEEFKTESSGLAAQQARSTAVSVVTKSGTNAFHGDLFEFLRNDLFNARQVFSIKQSTLKRNQFGGTLGGPILKKKLFFFVGGQGTTIRQDPANAFAFVPTVAMLDGDFTEFAGPTCNSGKTLSLKAPFVNNRIDPALLDPSAVKLTALLPQPGDPCGKVSFGQTSNSNSWQAVARIDYQLSEKHLLFGRFLKSYENDISPFYYTPDNILNAINGMRSFADAYTLGSTYVIDSRSVNSFRLSYSSDRLKRTPQQYYGYEDIGVNVNSKYPKSMAINVTSGFTLPSAAEGGFRSHLYQLADDLSMTRNRHQLRFGVHLVQARSTGIASVTSQGVFNFTGAAMGAGLADFLLGRVNDFTQGENQETHSIQNFAGLYAQDAWQVRPRLTLNYGLRWSPVLPIEDIRPPVPQLMNFSHDRYLQGIRSSVFVNAPPGFLYAGDPGFVQNNNGANAEKPKADVNNPYFFRFTPRIGLAWDIRGDGRTALLASYGLNYEDPDAASRLGSQSAMSPWDMSLRLLAPVGGFGDPYADVVGGSPFPLTVTKDVKFPPRGDYLVVPGNLDPTYTQSWNLSIQRQIAGSTVLSASYLGTKVTHLRAGEPLNQAVYIPGVGDGDGNCFLNGESVYFNVTPGEPCSTLGNTQARRTLALQNPPFAQEIGRMAQIVNEGTQNYHGLLLSIETITKPINISANYTWSHCIGDYAARENYGYGVNVNTTYLDPTNPRRDRANCETDQRNILNLTVIAKTPKFANRTLNLIGTGWQLSVLYRAATSANSSAWRTVNLGDPANALTTGNGIDRCLCDSAVQRPDRILTNIYKDTSGDPGTQYLNPSAFALPAFGTLGSAGRGIVKLPYDWQFDAALSRMFQLRETQTVEFRAEAFNVTNSFRPGDINLNFTSSQFGKILKSMPPRIMQFAVRYRF